MNKTVFWRAGNSNIELQKIAAEEKIKLCIRQEINQPEILKINKMVLTGVYFKKIN
jgi:hypothetical protein